MIDNFQALFNTREQALIIWLLIVITFLLISKFPKDVLKAFFQVKILMVLCFCWLAIIGVMIAGKCIGLWNNSMIKDSVIFMLSVFVLLNKVIGRKSSSSSFTEILKDVIQPIVAVEFITNLQTFSLGWELVLLPILTLLVAMTVLAESKPEHLTALKFINFLLSCFGIYILSYSLYQIVINFNTIDRHQESLNLLLPIWLTLGFIPFLYLVKVFSTYEDFFVRINTRVKKRAPELASYFKRKLILKCLLSIRRIQYYDSKFAKSFVDSKQTVDEFLQNEKREPIS